MSLFLWIVLIIAVASVIIPMALPKKNKENSDNNGKNSIEKEE